MKSIVYNRKSKTFSVIENKKQDIRKQFNEAINWEDIIGNKPDYHVIGDSGYMSLEIWEATKFALNKIAKYDGSMGPMNNDLIESFCQEGVARKAPEWVHRDKDKALKYVIEKVTRNKSKVQ